MDTQEKAIVEAKYMLEDLLAGDDSIDEKEEWNNFSTEVIQSAKSLILDNENLSLNKKLFYLNNLWKINYRGTKPPPTIEEFLTHDYLGATVDGLYPYIKEGLIEYFNPDRDYRQAILYLFIGAGKSYFSVISTLFILTHLILMKNPNKFFGLNSATEISQGYFSFTLDKVEDLLTTPTQLILQGSPMFEKCRTIESLAKKEREYGAEKFCWTTATKGTSYFSFSNGATIKIGSDPKNLIGTQILTGVISELTFASEFGMSQDSAYRLLNDLKSRINSRFQGNYFSRTIIDSSPNSLENKVDNYILNIAPKEPRKSFIMKGAEWEYKTWEYENVKETFPVFKGSTSNPPKILDENEVGFFDSKEIILVPKTPELVSVFQNDLIKALKDRAGIPAGTQDKLIYDYSKIEKIFDNNSINNLYSCIFAPANMPPENLIWDAIKDDFFIKIGNSFEFYSNPKIKRYVGIDQSFRTDTTGISMVHREIDKNGKIVYIVDFTIAITPNKQKINLEAIKFFIHDLRRKGKLNIAGVSFDQFQSESTVQYLEREGFEVKKVSVDRTTAPYLNLINLINTNSLKAGKNLFLKNNLKSLIMTKSAKKKTPKVDHVLGDVSNNFSDTDWDKSMLGFNAKDISDSVAGAVTLCDQLEKYTPTTIYSPQESGFSFSKVSENKGYNVRKEIAI